MLTSLAIRDIVLIERLELEFGAGLCVLTGETGAGKSILLDAVGLALGGRSDRALVRQGAARGSVTAVFTDLGEGRVQGLLAEHGIEAEDELVLRRLVAADGRSRAFVNDQPISSGLLRRLGELLVEVHGQHEQQALLEPGVQRGLLDHHGRLAPLVAAGRRAWQAWCEAEAARSALATEVERAATEEAYWRHVLTELETLAPEVGEETRLAATRARLMQREKLRQALDDALAALRGQDGAEARLVGSQRVLERVVASAGEALEPAMAALERARVEIEEGGALLERAGQQLELDGDRLEAVEERLFALRAAARKHRLPVDGLAGLRAELALRIAGLNAGGERLAATTSTAAAAQAAFVAAAERLSAGRARAAGELAKAVMLELPPLRLDKARFQIRLIPLAAPDWSGEGIERVTFEIATNPGQEPAPLAKIASGGELARLMLALKVVLAQVGSTPCLVFDEVDSGIGGATADAVGERLARIGAAAQVLVVTHAPQVAARADHHWRVEKSVRRGRASVAVVPLEAEARREEIARMLAGAKVTEAARAAAASLIAESA